MEPVFNWSVLSKLFLSLSAFWVFQTWLITH